VSEFVKLREFVREFRAWQRQMNNVAFRSLLSKLEEVERSTPRKGGIEMGQNWWVFKDGRTNPGKYHRTGGDGLLVGTVEILREGDVDASGHDAVEFQKVTPTHLDYLLGQKVLADSPGWREALWGPSGEWLGPHGVLFAWEGEYPADLMDDVFARLEAVRSGPPLGRVAEAVQPIGASELPGMESNAPAPAPARKPDEVQPETQFDPRDKDKDGVVSKQERKDAKHSDGH
jgi:hypothetical protein